MADFRTKNLDFVNPLESNSNDISFDYQDLIDKKSSLYISNEAMDAFTRRNVFKGVREYVGLVIQISTDYVPPSLLDIPQDPFGTSTATTFFKAHIPTLHASIGNPCDIGYLNRFGTSQDRVQAALKRIQNHPWFIAVYSTSLFSNRAPTFGDIVKIKFLKDPSAGRLIQGEIVDILSRANMESLDDLCGQSSKDLFGGYNPNYGKPIIPLDEANSFVSTTNASQYPRIGCGGKLVNPDAVRCPASGLVIDCSSEAKRATPNNSAICFLNKQIGCLNFHTMKDNKNNYRAGLNEGISVTKSVQFFKELKDCFGIVNVVTLASDSGNDAVPSLVKQVGGMNSHKFSVGGDTAIAKDKFEQIKQILAQGNTLVHCTHGADRTGAVVSRYYVESLNWTTERAASEMATYSNSESRNYEFPGLVRFVKEGAWR